VWLKKKAENVVRKARTK